MSRRPVTSTKAGQSWPSASDAAWPSSIPQSAAALATKKRSGHPNRLGGGSVAIGACSGVGASGRRPERVGVGRPSHGRPDEAGEGVGVREVRAVPGPGDLDALCAGHVL